MRVIFSTNPGIFSHIIRFFTFSKFSHVSIQLDEEFVIDATFLHGVSKRPIMDLLGKAARVEMVELDVEVTEEAILWLNSQLGKKYDVSAVLGLPFTNRDYNEDDKWFCSELTATFLDKLNLGVYSVERLYRVTPEMLYCLDWKKIAK